MKRKAAGFVFLLLCICLIKGTASSAATQVASGSCGENATWTLDDENVLTIKGTGKISDNSWVYSWEWNKLTEYPSPHEHDYDFEDNDPHFVTVVIEDGITAIRKEIFASPYIKKVSIPNSVTVIGAGAFEKSSIKKLDIPDSVDDIGKAAFKECLRLTEVKLPEKITQIPEELFYGCEALERITIPDSVIMVENLAFFHMGNLKEITFGKNLVSISEMEFRYSWHLRKITNRSNTHFSFSKLGVETEQVTWYEDGEKATDIPPGTTVTGKGKKYKFRYALDGAKVKGTLPKSFRYGDTTKFPTKVTKKGYLFLGWMIFHKANDENGGYWQELPSDSRGTIYCEGLFWNEGTSLKVSPILVKVKVQKKSKKTIILLDCRKAPFDEEVPDNVAIRYADNKKMKRFKVACNEQKKKNRTVKYVLPKSFQNRRCYVQCAIVDNVEGAFVDFYKDAGWEVVDKQNWFWSKSVVVR